MSFSPTRLSARGIASAISSVCSAVIPCLLNSAAMGAAAIARGCRERVTMTCENAGASSATMPGRSLSEDMPITRTALLYLKYCCNDCRNFWAESWLCAPSAITNGWRLSTCSLPSQFTFCIPCRTACGGIFAPFSISASSAPIAAAALLSWYWPSKGIVNS